MNKKNQKYTLQYETDPKQSDTNYLTQKISEYAKEKKGLNPGIPFAYFYKDKDNSIIAGCNGYIFYGCLHIDQLWVHTDFRGQNFGTVLMKQAQELGIKNNCSFLTVNTMDWEALDFYKKLGFELEFLRTGYANDSTFYFLKKPLTKLK